MRSKSKYPSFVRCSMNPDPNHFVKHKYLYPFINNDQNDPKYGVLDKDLSGKIRYYLFDRGEIHSSWAKEELQEQFPDKKIRHYTAVSSSLKDNPAMMAANPDYADDLEANDPANAAMLLDGNWEYQPAANGIFDRTTVNEITYADVPHRLVACRAWDKAVNEPSKEKSSYDPDYTTSVKIARDSNKNYYVFGEYIKDGEDRQISRFRKKVGARNKLILEQSELDGDETIVVLPQDPAAAGKVEFEEHAKDLQAEGFTVKKDPMPYNKSKILRFQPFCAASHNGYVYFVIDSFDKKALDYLYLELENFDGDTNNGYKDDMVDATGSAFNFISRAKIVAPVVLPTIDQGTKLSRHKDIINKR